jgi:hypothetical protein
MRSNADKKRIENLIIALGRAGLGPGRVYFTGGATAVLFGWREMTLDVDFKLDPEPSGIFNALPDLKLQLDVNLELAAPDQFIPTLPGWRERSLFISRHGSVEFYHYDLYSQSLSKIERNHARDQLDVRMMFELGLVERGRLWQLFQQIEPELIRYPAIEPSAFRGRVQKLTCEH